ncbi:thioredoxin 1 [Mesonia algae]|uniref:Thioredoxin 1 n=1 Tax=Mesonia algae TaxID=213248 RepID=A0A2W7I4H1_9FLAO|nr:thioredoxin family protein [Mesonia algae]PZW41726.1 thioredoxin 1 [Mesonia algae]
MSKFGELIDSEKPVLLNFHPVESGEEASRLILKDVAATLGEKVKVIKIEVEKNKSLVEALRISEVPTYILYKNGEMLWRHSGEQNADSLISVVEKHI